MEKFAPSQPPNPPPQPTPKPEDVSLQDFMLVGDGGKFYALGSDERVYFYNAVNHSWFLVQSTVPNP